MKVDVRFSDGRQYPIYLEPGGLEGLGGALHDGMGGGRVVVVTNTVVAPLYLDAAVRSLSSAGFNVDSIVLPDGEASKNLATWQNLVLALLDRRVDRGTVLVALGGGVAGDLVGFAAATVLRGIRFVQVPTTLLAMVDSSVGGKVGVDTAHGKNLVGAFHQPVLVYAAMATLVTLDDAEFRSGLGEVLKHAVIADKELFDVCDRRAAEILARDGDLLSDVVARSVRVKAAVVTQDEREEGLRAILNFGHTVGHAVETAVGFGALRHGECVVIGMLAESRWAAARGDCSMGVVDEEVRVARHLGLVTQAPSANRQRLLDAATHDKKRVHGTLRTAVLERIGTVRLDTVAGTEVDKMLTFLS